MVMAGTSTSRPFRPIPLIGLPVSILGVLFIFFLVRPEGGVVRAVISFLVRPEGWGVRAELSDMAQAADRGNCFESVSSWSEAQLHKLSSMPLDRLGVRNWLFFLHIPRTGGRTFHQCFLTHIVPSDHLCKWGVRPPKGNHSAPPCRVISTHHDYSLADELHHDKTSVLTSLRDPVERALSAYEFSIEVAARSFVKIPTDSKLDLKQKISVASKGTFQVWPWKHLASMMEQDLFERRDARRALKDSSPELGAGTNIAELTEKDSYNANLIAMPFHEFIHKPEAHELVHNGQTFQVAGLTNISSAENAGEIRRCVIRFPHLGKYVVDVAKKRLDRMLYVGLAEQQNIAPLYFTEVLWDQISMEALMRALLNQKLSWDAMHRATKIPPNFTSLEEFTKEEVIQEMMLAYEDCVAHLRKKEVIRRTVSLEHLEPINFSREMRKFIPDSVIAEVAGLNQLDQELYAHAQVLFLQENKYLEHEELDYWKYSDTTSNRDSYQQTQRLKADFMSTFAMEDVAALWDSGVLLVLMIIIALVAGCHHVTKRRGIRVKDT